MSGRRKKTKPVTLEGKLRQLTTYQFVPVLALIAVIFSVLISYSSSYRGILHNVTTASEFNQDFKETIDLEMYYYVVESRYSQGLPVETVQDAQALAQDLRDTTTQKESRDAINSVVKLCASLESKMSQIEETESYDERSLQLENNIYVLTEMIQEYMYTYLYYEAVQLDSLQERMTHMLYLETGLLIVFVILLLTVNVRRSLKFGRSITDPIGALCVRVRGISEGDLTVQDPVEAQEYEIQTLSNGVEQMVERLNRLLEQSRQEQISLRSAELALLQAQINPHFLYNTLDTIIWLIEMEQYQQAVEMVTSLSGYFRSSLSKGRDVITLREEEQHVRSYLEIQQVRYKDILQYKISIDDSLYQYEIPKLTLQPLVENALYHGIKRKRGLGVITVTGEEDGDRLLLTVTDNGAGMDEERLRQVREGAGEGTRIGFGYATVQERLQLFFGAEYGLEIFSREGEGTCVKVHIPKRPAGEKQPVSPRMGERRQED
ncbi:MAG: histidine kinase [Clostridiales bacterium]|nr:histidine kinase [Clostridiales bacterium]